MSIVTAVIPCYNAGGYLAEAIASVKAQTVPVAEILVVDDGSQDNSAFMAQAAGARVLSTAGRKGPGAARNLGAKAAKTPFVGFLDADDLWLPRHCELLLERLNADPAAAVAFGRIQQFDQTGEIETPPPRRAPNEGSLINLLIDNPIAQSAALVRREQLFAVAGYREEMQVAEDYDLWLRLAEEHSWLPIESVTCRYRLHHNQTSRSLPAMIKFGWKARMDSRKRLRDKGIYLPEHEAALRMAVRDDTITAWVASDLESLRALLAIAESIEHAGVLRQSIRARMLVLPAKRFLGWKPHLRNN